MLKTEQLVDTNSTTAHPQHHKLSRSKLARHEHSITRLKSVLGPCKLFKTENAGNDSDPMDSMFKLMSKEIIPDEIKQSILATEVTGKAAYKSLVEDRIIGSVNLWDKMTQVK